MSTRRRSRSRSREPTTPTTPVSRSASPESRGRRRRRATTPTTPTTPTSRNRSISVERKDSKGTPDDENETPKRRSSTKRVRRRRRSGKKTPVRISSGKKSPVRRRSGKKTPVRISSGKKIPVRRRRNSGERIRVRRSSGKKSNPFTKIPLERRNSGERVRVRRSSRKKLPARRRSGEKIPTSGDECNSSKLEKKSQRKQEFNCFVVVADAEPVLLTTELSQAVAKLAEYKDSTDPDHETRFILRVKSNGEVDGDISAVPGQEEGAKKGFHTAFGEDKETAVKLGYFTVGAYIAEGGDLHEQFLKCIPTRYLVVVDKSVVLDTFDMEKARLKLQEYKLHAPTPARMVCAVVDGKVVDDPHPLGADTNKEGHCQGGGARQGWNKWWQDWHHIRRMNGYAQEYLDNKKE